MIQKKKSDQKNNLAKRWDGLDLDLLPIDSLDVKILDILKGNSRLSNAEIARMLKTSEATIRRRIKSMVDKGIIVGFSTYINYSLIENPVKAYIHIKVRTEKMDEIVEERAIVLDYIALFLEFNRKKWRDFSMIDDETGQLIELEIDVALKTLGNLR